MATSRYRCHFNYIEEVALHKKTTPEYRIALLLLFAVIASNLIAYISTDKQFVLNEPAKEVNTKTIQLIRH